MNFERDTCTFCGAMEVPCAVHEEGIDRVCICLHCAREASEELERIEAVTAMVRGQW